MTYVQTECDFCGWDGAPLEEAWSAGRGAVKRLLCQVCRSTPAGNASLYPEQFNQDEKHILQTQAWGINYLASLIQSPVVKVQPSFEEYFGLRGEEVDDTPADTEPAQVWQDGEETEWDLVTFRPEIEALLLDIGLGTLSMREAVGRHDAETIKAARMMHLVTTRETNPLGLVALIADENGRAWLNAQASRG